MSGRIEAAFAALKGSGRKALIPFVTAGDPQPDQTVAIMLFILNLIALGLGPLAVGALSDALKETYQQDSLRYALMLTSLVNVWAAVHFILAGNAYAKEMAAKG